MCGTCGARTTHIRSQRARVSSVGKTPSFSFCQVDIHVGPRGPTLFIVPCVPNISLFIVEILQNILH